VRISQCYFSKIGSFGYRPKSESGIEPEGEFDVANEKLGG
jgi:hypothetical protein